MELINNTYKRSAVVRRHAKSLLVFSLFTSISSAMAAKANAQNFAEWFEQGKTQKKYLLQQIAALQVFSGALKQGYLVASKGLGSISGNLKGENSLHANYYNRLKTVDAAVKGNPMVKEILTWQADILKRLANINQVKGMTSDEKKYLASVRTAVLADCNSQISTLQNVITDGKLEMSDAERIALISKIHTAMMDNYRFASGFAAQANIYATQRLQEQSQLAVEKQLYGIN